MAKILTIENVIKLAFLVFSMGAMWNRLDGLETRVNEKLSATDVRTIERLDFLKFRIERMERKMDRD